MRKGLLPLLLFIVSGALLFCFQPSQASDNKLYLQSAPGDPASIQNGKEVYERKCQWCHGINGDGKGSAESFVNPKPRDFTKGEYKFRSTQSGEIPTDYDLFKTIANGLPGTAMYGWGNVLTEKERWDLVAYIKTFSQRFKNEQYTKDKLLVPPYPGDPGKATADLIKQGDQLFHDKSGAKCFMCHGDQGRGNGPSADTLTDDWNNKIWPADLTKGYDFRGGDSAEDIYRDISTGLEGSPMPSFRGALDSDDKKDEAARWALAYYVKSLQMPRRLGSLVRVVRVKGGVPTDPNDPRWNSIDLIDIPLSGQVIQNPREFTPSVDNLSIKACYDDKNVSFLLSWDDRTKSSSTEESKKQYPDASGLEFPVGPPADPSQSVKPYFAMGDTDHPVDLWYWNAKAGKVTELNSRGFDKIVPKNGNPNVSAKSIYDDGIWRVVFTRPLTTASGKTDSEFEIGKYLPVAFAVWDGGNGEHKGEKAISSWFYLLLIPPASSGVYIAPAVALFIGIFLELWVAGKAKEHSDTILS